MRITGYVGAIAAFSLALSGCVNPYEKFYKGQPNGAAIPNYVPSTAPLAIYSTDNFTRDVIAMERKGYAPIGNSSFNAASNKVTESQLRDQAGRIGAAAVLISSHYTHTVSGAMPLVLPNNSTSYTTGNATVSGYGGVANVAGSATTTTYGTQTVMMPYSIARSDFGAVYFVKVRPHFGAFYGQIDDATRNRLQTNAGVLIASVVDGTPASRADILPGDIVLTADGQRVDGPEPFNEYIKAHLGQELALEIDRNGARIEKKVTPAP